MHVCIFRTDRIGDLILTLPMAAEIKRSHPGARVTFCVQTYTRELALRCPDVDDVIDIPDRDIRNAAVLARQLRSLGVTAAVFAYPRPGLAWAALRAGVPIRIGTAYRWWSPLYNRRIREHRRDGTLHEATYNLHLLAPLGIPGAAAIPPVLNVTGADAGDARTVLADSGIPPRIPYVVLHPGSGGSARDWSPAQFGALAARLLAARPGLRVLVTGSSAEQSLVDAVLRAGMGERPRMQNADNAPATDETVETTTMGMGERPRMQDADNAPATDETVEATAAGGVESAKRLVRLARPVQLPTLVAVLRGAALFVSNSTGPLHIAAAHGVPVIGLYPFLPVCSPQRWGPLAAASRILTPPLGDGCARCLRGVCAEHDDMARISVDDVFQAAAELLDLPRAGSGVSHPES